jgi:hypothetical protein
MKLIWVQERVRIRSITDSSDPQTGLCTLIPTKEEDQNKNTDWENIWQNARCKGLTPAQSSFLFKLVHNLLPNNSKLLKFGLRENDICTFCTQSDNKSHLWFCTQTTGLGMVVRAILQEHSVQNQQVPWDSLCRLEVDQPQHHTLQAMVMVAEVGAHITANRPRDSSRNQRWSLQLSGSAALQASKKHELAGRALLEIRKDPHKKDIIGFPIAR